MNKIVTKIFTVIGALTIFVVIPFLIISSFLYPMFEWEYEEQSRIESPDGEYEIVLFRGNAGAVSGYTYELYIVEKGKDINRELDGSRHVFTAYEHTELLDYKWVDDSVEITIKGGSVHYMTYYGFWEDYEFRKVGDVVLKVGY